MIGKVPRAGRGFRGLVRYLLHGARRSDTLQPRVAWTATRNLLLDDPAKAPLLMRMTATKSVRVRRPVYHLVISWTPDERPTPEMMRQVADTTCRDLGLAGHQRLYVAHRDTHNPHLHIVVNRVHPETGTAWATSNDYKRVERSLARQARALGLQVVPGRHNGLLPSDTPRRARDGAYQKERRETGARPQDRWSAERIAAERPLLAPMFQSARSWPELTAALADRGLALRRKGQGLVVVDATGEMKLSELGTGVRLVMLEARLGKLAAEAADLAPARRLTRRRNRQLMR